MARYISLHSLSCLTRQGAEELAARLNATGGVSARRVLLNMVDGKMLLEFDAADRESAEAWLRAERVHYDWLMRVEWESQGGKLRPVP